METEFFIHTLFNRLRRRRFPLAYEDYQALRLALRAGFGWESPHALCEVCCALWAKSLQEREIVSALFQELFRELELEQWELPELPKRTKPRNLPRVFASEVIRRLRVVIPILGESPEEEPLELRELLLPKLMHLLHVAKQIAFSYIELRELLLPKLMHLLHVAKQIAFSHADDWVIVFVSIFLSCIFLYCILIINGLILKIFLILGFIYFSILSIESARRAIVDIVDMAVESYKAIRSIVVVEYYKAIRSLFKLKTHPIREFPPIPWQDVKMPERTFTFVPQFSLAFRESVQAWRRLWRPVREGAPTELDIDATVERRSHLGIASSIVLVPPHRNKSRLLLLVDRDGSMRPFHQFVAEICRAVQQSGRMEQVSLYYFHDVPVEGADESVLAPVSEQLFPTLDLVLTRIEPLVDGNLFDDPEMLSAHPVAEVLETVAVGSDVILLSDGGAARGRYDLLRLLDTIAFLKALRTFTQRYVWLNPLPEEYWNNTTAAQIARHVPMFPLTRDGLHRAVNVLHGKPYSVERPF